MISNRSVFRPLRAASILATLAAGTLPAAAADLVWEMKAGNATCRVSFVQGKIAEGIARLQVYQPCTGPFAKLVGWSSAKGGAQINLYAIGANGPDLAGRADKERRSLYFGMIGDSTRFEMKTVAANAAPPAPKKTNPAKVRANSACLVMRDSGECAKPAHIGAPAFPRGIGAKSRLMPVTRLDIRFSANPTSSTIGTVEGGMCVEVTECKSGFNGEIWCETPSGNSSGWILKQDKSFVYARNSCD